LWAWDAKQPWPNFLRSSAIHDRDTLKDGCGAAQHRPFFGLQGIDAPREARHARQQGGLTALHAAAHNGDRTIVEMLLLQGADRNIADATGKTAEQHAREGGHVALAALIEARGV
jgi:hypothetical protein